jgi:DNA-binding transcriptional LysR family regulator
MDYLDLRRFRYFLAVAETLHFGRAAQKLGVAQPNLSQQIKNLETALGYALFERTTRGVKLTAVGSFLWQRVELLQANSQETIQTAQRIGRGEEGSLSIGFSGSAMYSTTPRVVEKFRRFYPKVVVQLRELYAHEQMPLLIDGVLDVGFIRDGAPTPGLRMTPLSRERFVAVLPEGHPTAPQRSIAPKQLKDDPFVLFSPKIARLSYEHIMDLCKADGFVPQILQEAPQWVTVCNLVAAGMGVSFAPACISRLSISGIVYRRLRSKAWSTIDAWTTITPTNPAVKPLLDIAEQEFRKAQSKD